MGESDAQNLQNVGAVIGAAFPRKWVAWVPWVILFRRERPAVEWALAGAPVRLMTARLLSRVVREIASCHLVMVLTGSTADSAASNATIRLA